MSKALNFIGSIFITAMVLAAILAAILSVCTTSGCTQADLIRWQPTEEQKQAADLAVTDVAALKPFVAPEAEPIRAEAEEAARVTQTYIGLPAKRPTPVQPENKAVVAQAGQDAAERPTVTQAANQVLDTTSGLIGAGIGLATTLAGIYGLKVRSKLQAAQTTVDSTTTALKETVAAVDQAFHALPANQAQALRDILSKEQSAETKVAISEAKHL